HPGFTAPQIGHRGALPAHAAAALGQASRRGRHPGQSARLAAAGSRTGPCGHGRGGAGHSILVGWRGMKADTALSPASWLAMQGWVPFDFQIATWAAIAEGHSGLLHATTGSGKTYAIWLGALAALREQLGQQAPPLRILWLTPMRALANDTTAALRAPMADMVPGWTLGARTGDISSAERTQQAKRLPTVLVTTPESLSLLLTRADARERLGQVRMVVVDEWHELLGSKRGVQVQLALARLRTWQ